LRSNNQSIDITLFKATFPLLGIVVIPIEAKAKIRYGYTHTKTQAARHCGVKFEPYFRVSLFVSGKISVLGLISAGIYAEGTFLDAKITNSIQVNAGRTDISIVGNMRAITLDIGATYTKISCSLSRAWRKNRNLGLRRRFRRRLRKIRRKVKKVAKKVKRTYNKVAKVVYRTYKVITNLDKICRKSNGYKKIYTKKSSLKVKTFYSKRINFGL